ncbi:hypothetical protein C1646_678223 [Rhizophagus diaphanus]|nr:hypothetical protein C1646_678223 [Rhizophagus diaphanus] [Rhizophagus sp. MUCL 43196]
MRTPKAFKINQFPKRKFISSSNQNREKKNFKISNTKCNRANKDYSDSSEKTDSSSSGGSSSVDESHGRSSKTKSYHKKSKRNVSRSSLMSHEERNTSRSHSMGNKERNKSRSSLTSHEERNKSHGYSMTSKERNSHSKTKSYERSIIRTSHCGSSEGTESHSSSETDNHSKSSRSSKRDNRRHNRSYRKLERNELSSIRSTLNYLVEEVHILKMKQSRNNTTINRDESDEIVQILAGLDDSLSLDHTKSWNEIYKYVSKSIMPAVDKALNGRIQYKPTELKYVLQQLHHHRRENWQISQDNEKSKVDKKRKKTNARRSDLKKLLRHADKVGESVQNIKVQRKRWYNDNDYQDHSTLPDGAPK